VERRLLREITYAEAEVAEKLAHKTYMMFKQSHSRAARDTFLDELADAIAKDSTIRHASVLKTLKMREFTRRMHRRITWTFDDQRKGAIMIVEAPDEHGNMVEYSAREDIERACLQENEQRFRQANDTPFMRSPLVDEFGYLGIGENSRAVLTGEYIPPPNIDKYAAMLLQHLKQSTASKQPPRFLSMISTEQYIQGWKHAKERTTTGSAILHFGHFKAGARDSLIADFEATMAHIPYATGYSPKRWCHVIDYELLKKEGVFRPETFRTIQLLEPDFNQNNKLLGKETMVRAERNQTMAPEQYGSRKNLSAILHAVNKVLSFDLIRQYKVPAAMCSNDAKSCYDRIVHNVASLCFQYQGVSEPPLMCMFTTLQNLEHKVRTAYGDSTQTYGGPNWIIPPPGRSMGNKDDGPPPRAWDKEMELLQQDGQ
jgi:hypothetical protein